MSKIVAGSYKGIIPICSPLPDGKRWIMVEPWTVRICAEETFDVITIPKGFIFDFASIPKFAWPLVGSPATGLHRYGAILHDYMYYMHFFEDRKYADDVFYAFNKQEGLSFAKNEAIYQAVRKFGWIGWKSHEKDSKKYLKIPDESEDI